MIKEWTVLLRQFDPRGRSEQFRRGLSNALWSSTDYGLLLFLWFLGTPVFVIKLGIEEYGIWMLVNALMGFSWLMTFGFGDSVIRSVSKYRGREDVASVIRVVTTVTGVSIVVGSFLAILLYVLAPFLASGIFKVRPDNIELTVNALRIGSVGVLVRFVDTVFQSLIQGYERYDLAAKISIPTNLLTLGGCVIIVLAGGGVLAVLTATVALTGAGAMAKAIVAKRQLLGTLSFVPSIERSTLRELFSFGFMTWVQGSTWLILTQLDRLLVASFVGASALAYYTVCLQIAQQIHTLMVKGSGFIFPSVSAAGERGAIHTLQKQYDGGMFLLTTLAAGLGLPVFLFAGPILSLWMGEGFASQTNGLLEILSFSSVLLVSGIVPFYFLNGSGFVRVNTVLTVASGVLVVAGTVMFIRDFGLIGAAWARLINIPATCVAIAIVHFRLFGGGQLAALARALGPIIIVFGLAWSIKPLLAFTSMSLWTLIPSIVVTGLVGIGLTSALWATIKWVMQKPLTQSL